MTACPDCNEQIVGGLPHVCPVIRKGTSVGASNFATLLGDGSGTALPPAEEGEREWSPDKPPTPPRRLWEREPEGIALGETVLDPEGHVLTAGGDIAARSRPFEEIVAEGWKPWWRFEWPYALKIAWGRFQNRRWRPIFRARMMWQRARYGISDEDAWGLHYHLAGVIACGVSKLAEWKHGHPPEVTYEEWLAILERIELGMLAARSLDDDLALWGSEDYDRLVGYRDDALDLLKKWWAHLWD